MDLSGKTGVRMGTTSNVVHLYRSTLLTNLLQVDELHLVGLFSQQFARRLFDRAGNLIEEKIGHVAGPVQQGPGLEKLFASEPQFQRFVLYHYQPGWLVEGGEQGLRQFAFQTSAPPAGVIAWRCNDGSSPDLPTAVIMSQTTSESKVDSDLLRRFVSRRLGSPRLLQTNPYMPGRKGVWTAWTSTALEYAGEVQFKEELIFDAEGTLAVGKASKASAAGGPASKIRYFISPLVKEEMKADRV